MMTMTSVRFGMSAPVRFSGATSDKKDNKEEMQGLVASMAAKVDQGLVTYGGPTKSHLYGKLGKITVPGDNGAPATTYFVRESKMGRTSLLMVQVMAFPEDNSGMLPKKEIVLKEGPVRNKYSLSYKDLTTGSAEVRLETKDGDVAADFIKVINTMKEKGLFGQPEAPVKPTF